MLYELLQKMLYVACRFSVWSVPLLLNVESEKNK
jgi:hypothetical protein